MYVDKNSHCSILMLVKDWGKKEYLFTAGTTDHNFTLLRLNCPSLLHISRTKYSYIEENCKLKLK